MSGALFVLFLADTPEQKTNLRAIFVAATAYQARLKLAVTHRALTNELSDAQRAYYLELENSEVRDLPSWIVAKYSTFGKLKPDQDGNWAKALATWIYLSQRYLARRLKNESEPKAVDWGRREQALRERLRQMGPNVSTVVNLEDGSLRILSEQREAGKAELEILGVYFPESKTYHAGWALRWVPWCSRPVPALGCASHLFRAEGHQVTAEVQRSGAILGSEYLLVKPEEGRELHLGLRSLTAANSEVRFEVADVRQEVLAKLDKLQQFASTQEPKRTVEFITAQIQDLGRLKNLFQPGARGYQLLEESSDQLTEVKLQLRTESFLGLSKSSLSRDEVRLTEACLDKLRTSWSSPAL